VALARQNPAAFIQAVAQAGGVLHDRVDDLGEALRDVVADRFQLEARLQGLEQLAIASALQGVQLPANP
jgi:hypothetical protein